MEHSVEKRKSTYFYLCINLLHKRGWGIRSRLTIKSFWISLWFFTKIWLWVKILIFEDFRIRYSLKILIFSKFTCRYQCEICSHKMSRWEIPISRQWRIWKFLVSFSPGCQLCFLDLLRRQFNMNSRLVNCLLHTWAMYKLITL